MKINISTKYLFLGILVVFLATFAIGWYISRQKADRASTTLIQALTGKLKIYEYKYDSVVKYAAERDQLIITQKQAIESGLIKQKELKALNIKKVSEVTSLKAQIRILADSVKHTGEVIVIHDTVTNDDQSMIILPFGFQDKTKYYELYGEFSETAELSLDLTVPVALDIFTGYDKKLKSYKAVAASDNPYFKVSEIKSIKVEAKKPFYNKMWFKVATLSSAFAAGVLIAK